MKRKIFFLLTLLSLSGITHAAYDFSAVCSTGQTLYYKIVNGNAMVTNQYNPNLGYSTYPSGSLTIPSTVTHNGVTYTVTAIGTNAFWGCEDLTSVTIPNSVTSIGESAFSYCEKLTSVTIPNSVTSIGNYAFSDCEKLTSVTIPNSVTSIGYYAFYDCSKLTSVTIPNTVTSIEDGTFGDCSSLTSVTIGNSVTSIGENAFNGCSKLSSITIPNSVTRIGEGAFNYCSNLTSVVIGNQVTRLSYFYDDEESVVGFPDIFYNCTKLSSIVVASGNPAYDSRNACNAIIETATNRLLLGCKSTVIPNSVTSIGNNAFSYCTGLTSIIIPNSVTSIGYYAFSYCTGLTSVTIGNSVTSVGSGAFHGCSNLINIRMRPVNPPSLGSYAFTGTDPDKVIAIPCGRLSAYQSAWGTGYNYSEEFLTYTLTLQSNNNAWGSVYFVPQNGRNISCNGTAVIAANASQFYHFTQWQDGNTDNPRTVTVTADVTYTAQFAIDNYAITALSNDATMGSVTGGGTYDHGTAVTLTAEAAPCHHFVAWSNGATTESITFNATEARTLTATFARDATRTGVDRQRHCNDYTWIDGVTYTASNNSATYNLYTAEGCDSTVTLNLTIADKLTSHEQVTHCGPYTWTATGQTYNKSGIKTYKGTTSEGCPVRDTLELTVVDHYGSHLEVTSCGSYTWAVNGKTYSKGGVKTNKGYAADGCPIRDTLTLNMVDRWTSHEQVTHCGPYTWTVNGKTYSKGGVKTNKSYAADGCPKYDTLTLTIVDKIASHEQVTHCGPYTWEVNGKTYSKSGVKTNKSYTENGCPVYDTLTLNIYDKITSHEQVTNCGPYTWNVTGQTYNRSGVKTKKSQDADGCPKYDTLTLTIVDRWTSHEQVESCGSYTWEVTGKTYSKSGTKYYKGTAEDGCPKYDTLDLTIVDKFTSHEYVTHCGPYTWDANGKTYSKSGTKYYSGTSPEGCPIRDTLTLTIVDKFTSHEYVTSCEPYTWEVTGKTYNKSGEKYYKGTTPEGCPIRDTLTLVVGQSHISHEYVTNCGPYTWEVTGQTYNKSGTKYYKSTTPEGCPIRDTLTLVVNPITTGDTFATATGRFVWYGNLYVSSTEAMRLMTNQYGCDSIVTLHLTINSKGGEMYSTDPIGMDADDALTLMRVYPNPTTGLLQIDAPQVDKVEVLDLVGRRVALFENIAVLDLSHLAEGTYMLRVTLPDAVVIRKVVKR